MTAASAYRGRRTGFTCDILALLSGQIININQCWEFRLLTCGGWELPKQSVLIVCSPSAWKRNLTRPDTSSCTKTTPLSHLQAPGRVIGSWCATAQAESRQNQAEFQHLSEPWENRGEHQTWVLEKQGLGGEGTKEAHEGALQKGLVGLLSWQGRQWPMAPQNIVHHSRQPLHKAWHPIPWAQQGLPTRGRKNLHQPWMLTCNPYTNTLPTFWITRAGGYFKWMHSPCCIGVSHSGEHSKIQKTHKWQHIPCLISQSGGHSKWL